MSATAIASGFGDPVHDSQKIFRAVLDAMARPGRIARLTSSLEPPPPLLATSASVLLALADYETAVWLDDTLAPGPEVGDFIRFHTGARLTRLRREADFAVIADGGALPPLASFAQGTPEYPDRSTTLIVQVETLTNESWHFRGPGILDRMSFRGTPLPGDFERQLAANRGCFPCGVDLVFVTRTEIAAVPRSCRIEEGA
jgi:alpha-D-ribose 1-methylphosphonate 5-triphosphate synthase subunit PhnH